MERPLALLACHHPLGGEIQVEQVGLKRPLLENPFPTQGDQEKEGGKENKIIWGKTKVFLRAQPKATVTVSA